jgi:hypothetical protein
MELELARHLSVTGLCKILLLVMGALSHPDAHQRCQGKDERDQGLGPFSFGRPPRPSIDPPQTHRMAPTREDAPKSGGVAVIELS